MELTLKNYWQLTRMLFNTIQNLSIYKGVNLDNNLIFKLQQFIPKEANVDCFIFSKDCSRTDIQIKMGNNKKLKDIVTVAYTFFAVTAYIKVKVIISYQ